MSWTVELTWNCTSCDKTHILGRHKTCPSCGSPRETGEMRMNETGESLPAVSDPDLLKLAGSGRDWFCSRCDAGNIGNSTVCVKCGASRVSKPAATGRDPSASGKSPRYVSAESPPPRAPRSTPKSPKRLLGAAALVAVGLAYAFLSVREIPAQVEEMTWTHTTIQETWSDTERSDWRSLLLERPEVPPDTGKGEQAGIHILSCWSKEHHKDRYQCGSHRECFPVYRTEQYACGTSCSDNGNGFATCQTKYCSKSVKTGETCHQEPDYCYRPVFQDYCRYATQTWKETNSATALGHGKDVGVAWPALPMNERQRLRESGTWTVRFDYGEDTYTHSTSQGDYNTWTVGDSAILEKRRIGIVKNVRKSGEAR